MKKRDPFVRDGGPRESVAKDRRTPWSVDSDEGETSHFAVYRR